MPETVLVVEDDDGVQLALEGILELEGYHVIIANDGVEGLDALARHTVQLILLDVMMPRMDGFAFADELRRRGLHGTAPILVLTADGRAQEKAARIGAHAHLMKPFDIPELLTTVSRLLRS